MATVFEKDVVTIPQYKYEELIKTSQKYEILYSLVYNKFKNIFDDVWEQLKDIDWKKYNEFKKEESEEK